MGNVDVRWMSFRQIAKVMERLTTGPFETLACCTEEGLHEIVLRQHGPLTYLTLPAAGDTRRRLYSQNAVVAAVVQYAKSAHPFDDDTTLGELIKQHMPV